MPEEVMEPVAQPQGQGDVIPEGQEVQPTEGQGHADLVSSLYDLNSVPEQFREDFAAYAKELDKKIQSKFQEAAEYRKGWEPYGDIGITEYEPDSIRNLLAFAEALNDPDTAKDAVLRLVENLGIDLAGAPVEDAEGGDDPLAEVRDELAEFRQWKAEQEAERFRAEEIDRLMSELSEVETLHGKPFTDEEKSRIVALAGRMPLEDEPIKAAYSLISEVSGDAQKSLVKAKAKQPRAAEPGGRASTVAPPVESFEEAKRIFEERRRQP